MPIEKPHATPAGRALSLPSPELVRVVDRLFSPAATRRLNRIVDMFKWEKRPDVPEDLGGQILEHVCKSASFRDMPEAAPWLDATGAPERFGVPEKRKVDRRTATLQVLQIMLDAESFYHNVPVAMDPKIVLLLYPRHCAHIMSLSSGYASPITAARILTSALTGTNKFGCCEWTNACYSRDNGDGKVPDRRCAEDAVKGGARRMGKTHGFYGGVRDKYVLILQELLTEGGVPFSVDHVGPNV